MRRRHGSTLVELMVYLGVSTVLLSMAIGLLHRVMFAEQRIRKNDDAQRSALRLGQQLRHDVRMARSADVSQSAATSRLELTLPAAERISYEITDGHVVRIETLPSSNDAVRRESYDLGEETICEFQQTNDPPRRIVFVAHRAEQSSKASPVTGAGRDDNSETTPRQLSGLASVALARVEISLGFDLRFSRLPDTQEDP